MKIDVGNNIIIRNSVVADVEPIASKMRALDRNEVWASHHKMPLNALMDGYKKSTLCFTVEYQGEPCAMFGTVPQDFLSDKASIWLLASDRLCECRKKLLRYDRKFIQYMLAHYSHLSNFVDIRNADSIRWLKWCKARLEEAKPFGVEGRLFQRFSFEKT